MFDRGAEESLTFIFFILNTTGTHAGRDSSANIYLLLGVTGGLHQNEILIVVIWLVQWWYSVK